MTRPRRALTGLLTTTGVVVALAACGSSQASDADTLTVYSAQHESLVRTPATHRVQEALFDCSASRADPARHLGSAEPEARLAQAQARRYLSSDPLVQVDWQRPRGEDP